MNAATATLARQPLLEDAPAPAPRATGVATVSALPIDAIDAELAREWDDLAAHAAEPNAFAERWFVMAGVAHLPGAHEVHMIEVRDGARLTGLLPVRIEPRYGRLPVAYVENWLHTNAFLGTPLLRRGHEAQAWKAILTLLDQADWAPGFLHLEGFALDGPVHQALAQVRRCDVIHRTERALLESDLGAQAYYEATVRKKKRKELKRLQSRLAELGHVETRRLTDAADLYPWTDIFLRLERAGWKGEAGSALACDPATEAFFRAALAGAWEAGKLEILRMDLAGRCVAMLVNFLTAPGSFSFKIAFDEEYARFSPGVLIQLDNYAILESPDIAWMDSCAAENHPMINSLWAERRAVGRVSVPLGGPWRTAQFHFVRTAERLRDLLRKPAPAPAPQPEETSDD